MKRVKFEFDAKSLVSVDRLRSAGIDVFILQETPEMCKTCAQGNDGVTPQCSSCMEPICFVASASTGVVRRGIKDRRTGEWYCEECAALYADEFERPASPQ